MLNSLPHMAVLIPYIEIVLGVVLIALILIQRSSASAGGALGSSENWGSVFHTRRGLEKTLFMATIIVAVLFALASFIALFL